ncbi:type II toxin-antitoxin system RelB/DinJ family antitoxin [Anaerovibrio sp.]|uniref:type II toxin-antitoxin system RelB/DinJ family antitoxin n=1 Tax=Anaerovibrio sp. TaxID=1872532 RepID=UPI00388E384A
MPTVPTQIRINQDVKRDVSILFDELGLDMSSAINLFLRQCLIHQGLPFKVQKPRFSDKTLAAMQEALEIENSNSVPSYDNMDELKKALMS